MIGGLLSAAVGAARGSYLGREDRRRRRLEDEQLARQNRISDANIAELEARTRERTERIGANQRAFERHGTQHPDELGDYDPDINYSKVLIDEADEGRRTTATRAEKGRTEREKIDALVATGMSPAVARARVVAGYDPDAAAEARLSRELLNESRRATIREKAATAATGGAKDPNTRKLSTLNTQIDDTRADVSRLERDTQKPLPRFASSADSTARRELAERARLAVSKLDSLTGVRDSIAGASMGRVAAKAAQGTPTPHEPDPGARDAEFARAAARYRRLLDAGADPNEARAAYDATVAQIARRYGMTP